ncbi:hypothetical protein SAMN05421666_2983 [Roseovarius nanhaiticus]|uniref:Uncharacterized protein n=1 Tax=Roseovarius nanhaiticus TaxID=573024 RepID=A0A1N7HGN9_9RHOB|nr:hypothetical protein SAMN05421666_2983 [Roseovarius nanhaiticus]
MESAECFGFPFVFMVRLALSVRTNRVIVN